MPRTKAAELRRSIWTPAQSSGTSGATEQPFARGTADRTSDGANGHKARRALFTVLAVPAARASLPTKEPFQESTWTDFGRHPATPGDC